MKGKRGAMGRDYADPEALVKLAAVPVKATARGATSGKPAVASPTKAEQVKQLQVELQETQGELRKAAYVLGLRPGDREGVKKVLQENPGKAREFLTLRQEVQDLRSRLDELESEKPTNEAKGSRSRRHDGTRRPRREPAERLPGEPPRRFRQPRDGRGPRADLADPRPGRGDDQTHGERSAGVSPPGSPARRTR